MKQYTLLVLMLTTFFSGRNNWNRIFSGSLSRGGWLRQIEARLCGWKHWHHTGAGRCWHQVSTNWGKNETIHKQVSCIFCTCGTYCKVASSLSFGSDMTLHGLDQLPISSVGAVVFGFTTQLAYTDLTLATLLLKDPEVPFLLEAPDATCRARTAGNAHIEIPCKTHYSWREHEFACKKWARAGLT